MMEQIQILQDAVTQALSNPTASPVVSAFVLTALVILLLMVVLGILLALTPNRRKVVKRVRRRRVPGAGGEATETVPGDEGAGDSPAVAGAAVAGAALAEDESDAAAEGGTETAPRSKRRVVSWGLVVALVVLALVVGYAATGTDAYCMDMCHSPSEAVDTAAEIDHASCTSCHEAPGVTAIVANASSRTRMAVAYATGTRPGGGALIPSNSCLHCHERILDETVETARGIRMSHAEPVEDGMTCTACHALTGHSERKTFSMSTCLPCHDGTTASADCEICHSGDPYDIPAEGSEESTQTLGSENVVYPVTFIDEKTCGGCHQQEVSCDPCHGLRMPHTEEFMASGHAPSAAWERKEMCFRCHEEVGDCVGACHLDFDAHAPGWKQEHRNAPWDSGCACHQNNSGREFPMCDLCH
jgi:multisubunit Na+/H+ antiporter MnhC subunit